MKATIGTKSDISGRSDGLARYWAEMLFAGALLLGVAARIAYGRGMPLWLDETFTGTIATQTHLAGLVRWSLGELTGPVFYGTMWMWVQLFGAGTEAMRLPSLILSIAAPLILCTRGHPDRQLRLLWASVALLWLPLLPFANDARPYALLFLLGCLQAIAFRWLIGVPRTRTALAWAIVTAALILTHYGALAIGAVQGLLYVLLLRRRALATWPASLVFMPVVAWMSWHLPFVLRVTGGGVHPSMDTAIAALIDIPATLFGTTATGLLVIVPIAVTLLVPRFRPAGRVAPSPDRVLAASGLVACLGTIALSVLHPGIVARYLTPSAPALLFGVALWLRWIVRRDARAAVLVLGVMASGVAALLWQSLADERVDARHHFALEPASLWLLERPPRRLVFLWTDPGGAASSARNLADLAGFVFCRDGHPVAVTVVRPTADTSAAARAAAGRDPDGAILWLANDRDAPVPTLPRIEAQDPGWECREFGGGYVTATACRRRTPAMSGTLR